MINDFFKQIKIENILVKYLYFWTNTFKIVICSCVFFDCDIINTFIKSFKVNELSFFYVVLALQCGSTSDEVALLPIIGFPSIDTELYPKYATGKKVNEVLKNWLAYIALESNLQNAHKQSLMFVEFVDYIKLGYMDH